MAQLTSQTDPKLLFLVAEDWYFCSHRFDLAKEALSAGYEVTVVTRVDKHARMIRDAGFNLVPLSSMRRAGTLPFRELLSILELWSIYRKEKPTLVHHVGLKPVVYGSLIARITRVRGVVNALAGLGFVFTSRRLSARLLRPFIGIGLSRLLGRTNARVIVQNRRDFELLNTEIGLSPDSVRLIRGSGVDPHQYVVSQPTIEPPLVVLISRMLWDKGIGEFVEAAVQLREKGTTARFALVGAPDPENPTSVSEEQLIAWRDDGDVEWWGYRSDIPNVLNMAAIVCLPTFYGEGVPRVLIEAMASGRAIITTDIPGCKELVEERTSGILVQPRNVPELVSALDSLISDPKKRALMGSAGRETVERSLSLSQVIRETLLVYSELSLA